MGVLRDMFTFLQSLIPCSMLRWSLFYLSLSLFRAPQPLIGLGAVATLSLYSPYPTNPCTHTCTDGGFAFIWSELENRFQPANMGKNGDELPRNSIESRSDFNKSSLHHVCACVWPKQKLISSNQVNLECKERNVWEVWNLFSLFSIHGNVTFPFFTLAFEAYALCEPLIIRKRVLMEPNQIWMWNVDAARHASPVKTTQTSLYRHQPLSVSRSGISFKPQNFLRH